MANIIKRIMYGTELVGYVTDSLEFNQKYIDKSMAINGALNNSIFNVKAVKASDGKYTLNGCNGTNLNELERLNINIPGIEVDRLNQNGILTLVSFAEAIKREGSTKSAFDGLSKFRNKYLKDTNIVVNVNRNYTGVFYTEVSMMLTWNNRSVKEYNNLIITDSGNLLKIKAGIHLKNGKYENIDLVIDGKDVGIDGIRSKLHELFRYIECNTYMSDDDALVGYKARNNGMSPKQRMEYKKHKCAENYTKVVDIVNSLRSMPELLKFINDKKADVATNERNCGSIRDPEHEYELIITWKVKGYSDTFYITLSRIEIYDADIVDSIAVKIKYKGLNHFKQWVYNYEQDGNLHNTIQLENVTTELLNDLNNETRKNLMDVIKHGYEIKDLGINSRIKNWLKG